MDALHFEMIEVLRGENVSKCHLQLFKVLFLAAHSQLSNSYFRDQKRVFWLKALSIDQ
jgi:hypothetical protein